MIKLNPNQSSVQIELFDYYFSNLNVMNQKHTVYRGKSPQQSYAPDLLQTKSGFQTKNDVCIQHSYPIEYICFSCSSSLLCSHCLTSSSHLGHDLKNLQRSRQLMKSQLQEWNILLQTRCQILGMWSDRLRNNRADIFEYAELYKQKLAAQFKELMHKLEQQLKCITNSITEFSNDYKNDYTEKAKQIRLRQIEIKSMIEQNSRRIQTASIQIQAQYYSNNKSKIEQLLNQSEIGYYKQLLIEPNWGINAETFKSIKALISKLNITFKSLDAQKEFSEFRQKVRESLKKSIKKSKKQLKLMDIDDRIESKSRNSNNCLSPIVSSFTPKNKSMQRRIKNKKSPGETLLKKKKKSLTKMVSMPVSPDKNTQKLSQPSPNASNKHLFKKK